MDCVADQTQKTTHYQTEIFSKDLHSLLDVCESDIKVLSLDCFDTLLWRKTAMPQGVFFDAQHQPTFKTIGLNPFSRMESERKARIKNHFNALTTEVTLEDIYTAYDKRLSKTQLSQLCEEELLTEINTCYAFPRAIELMHEAHKRGMKIIIVSDTYLNENALRQLLKSCLPENTYAMINAVFCSSDYKKSKKNGLFYNVIKHINHAASEIWHVGDNYHSDFLGAQECQIRATHLIAHASSEISTLLRLRTFASGFLDSKIGYERAQNNPFLGVISQTSAPLSLPEYLVGYLSLGPILYAFSTFIKNEVENLRSQGKNPKVLFLLRDGYLPSRAFDTLMGEKAGYPVYISRFSAIAASFRNKDDVDDYLYKFANPKQFQEITKQLLIPKNEAEILIQTALQSPNPVTALVELIHEPKCLNQIYENSSRYRKRLYRYLEIQTNLTDNDTVIFADLGYTGTAQIKLAPIFKEERNIDLLGRYFIACYIKEADTTRRGLIDSTWCDDRAYSALITFISLFEKLCSINGNSVIDYEENGNPIFSNSQLKNKNVEKITLIQEKTLEFIHDVKQFTAQTRIQFNNCLLRDSALSELARLLFFPTQAEMTYLKTLEYEIDMGSYNVLPVFDEEKGLQGLKRRGLFFMEKNRGSMRTNFPAELRHASIELSTMLLMQERLKFDLRIPDFSLRREAVPLIVMHNGEGTNATIDAIPTYDGYYSLTVPINFGEYQIGIQFGLKYQWLQIDSIEMIPSNALYRSHESDHVKEVKTNIHFQEMTQKGIDLYESQSKASMLIYLGDMNLQTEKQVLHIVFRPICRVQ